jgi:hexosaminidase
MPCAPAAPSRRWGGFATKTALGVIACLTLSALLLGTPTRTQAVAAPPAIGAFGIVPKPRHITPGDGIDRLPRTPVIRAESAAERDVAAALASFLRGRGLRPVIVTSDARPADVRLTIGAPLPAIGAEGYRLDVGAGGITLAANAGAGLYYGVQTLEQLFPVSSASGNHIAAVSIVDWPAYRWRGIHLDVSRHFFGVPVVERYIDIAAHYKLNTFHWHLTDDQGWRFPVADYPKLTTIGACRDGSEVGNDPTVIDPHRYCGAYTRAQIRAVVAYARARYVTIVPEIEMPGHAVAALTAYPWLACGGGPFHVRQTWGVSTDILCPTERTFAFVAHVLDAVRADFPGPYIHIGGDEVPTDAWQRSATVHALMRREQLGSYAAVQGYFTRRVERYLETHDRKLIGWDEILDGGVSTHATVMSWRGTDGGIAAARRGNDVVMTPDGPLYLDWVQGDTNFEPVGIDGLSTPQMIYDFQPTPASLTARQARHILGVQGNLWTERIPTSNQLFYLLLPRELAVAEDGWTPSADRVWSDFAQRCGRQYAWLENARLRFRIPDPTISVDAGAGPITPESVTRSVNETELRVTATHGTIAIHDDVPDAQIYYTRDDSVPTTASLPYRTPISYDLSAAAVIHVRAIAVLPSGRASAPTTVTLRR